MNWYMFRQWVNDPARTIEELKKAHSALDLQVIGARATKDQYRLVLINHALGFDQLGESIPDNLAIAIGAKPASEQAIFGSPNNPDQVEEEPVMVSETATRIRREEVRDNYWPALIGGVLGFLAIIGVIVLALWVAEIGPFSDDDNSSAVNANANANANANGYGVSDSDTNRNTEIVGSNGSNGSTTNGGCSVIQDYQLQDLPEVATSGSHLRVQYWDDGTAGEKETFLPASAADGGRFNLARPLQGHVWEFSGCTEAQMLQDSNESHQRRLNGHADNVGYVEWCTTGLFIPSQDNSAPTTCNSSSTATSAQPDTSSAISSSGYSAPATPANPTPAQASTCPDGVRGPDHDSVAGQYWTPIGDPNTWRSVIFWSNWDQNQGESKIILAPGDPGNLPGGGSFWSWPANCEAEARSG